MKSLCIAGVHRGIYRLLLIACVENVSLASIDWPSDLFSTRINKYKPLHPALNYTNERAIVRCPRAV